MRQPEFGVSFSIKQCRNFEIHPEETLSWLLDKMSFKRFRLMSYWNEHETNQGNYNFKALDTQIEQIEKAGGTITLCLGARQPRWPENHWPEWAWQLPKFERTEALYKFITTVVERYKERPSIVSWQLENEALLEEFGQRSEVDRNRLKNEYSLVTRLDQTRPVIMTTSTSWGIPLRRPIPSIVGFSMYNIVFNKGAYRKSLYYPIAFRFRAILINILWWRPSFIHELQAEPWGPKNIWEMEKSEQDKSMNLAQLEKNINLAKKTNLYPIDLWGGEWWYWRHKHGDSSIAEAVKKALETS